MNHPEATPSDSLHSSLWENMEDAILNALLDDPPASAGVASPSSPPTTRAPVASEYPALDLSAFSSVPPFSDNSWPTTNECVHVFLDNSYMFIEGQKAAAIRRGLRSRLDPRIRIHMAQLRQKLCGPHRTITRSRLYGSEAQSLSSVWSSAKSAETEVQVFRRSPITGKERNVEAKIVSDLTQLGLEFAAVPPAYGERHTAVILTGDQAVVQPCRQLLQTTSLNIELHAYKHSHSRLFEVLASEFPARVRICLLEEVFDEVTFTNTQWDEAKKPVPQERTLLLTLSLPSVFDSKDATQREVERFGRSRLQIATAQRLTEILRLPVMTCFRDATHMVASVVPSELSGEYSFHELLRENPQLSADLTRALHRELYPTSTPDSQRLKFEAVAYAEAAARSALPVQPQYTQSPEFVPSYANRGSAAWQSWLQPQVPVYSTPHSRHQSPPRYSRAQSPPSGHPGYYNNNKVPPTSYGQPMFNQSFHSPQPSPYIAFH